MAYLGIPMAILLMYAAQRMEKLFGAASAGWFAALPIPFAVASVAVAINEGSSNATNLGWTTAGTIGPTMVFAMAFVAAAQRLNVALSIVLAFAAFVAAVVLVTPWDLVPRVIVATVLILLASFYMTHQPRSTVVIESAGKLQQALALVTAGAVVALITAANQFSGPILAGAIGAFPTMTTIIAVNVGLRSSVSQASAVMRGMVGSMPVSFLYFIVFALVLSHATVATAGFAAIVAALVVGALTWRLIETNS